MFPCWGCSVGTPIFNRLQVPRLGELELRRIAATSSTAACHIPGMIAGVSASWGQKPYLWLVGLSREWRNGVQLLLLLLPFFHSLLTQGRKLGKRLDSSQARSTALQVFASGLSSGQFH